MPVKADMEVGEVGEEAARAGIEGEDGVEATKGW